MSLQEVLDSYSHITLTEDELREALIWAKRKKELGIREAAIKKRAEENRKRMTGTQWDYEQTKSFMLYRAANIFDKPFVIDDSNRTVFDLLCYYFSNDENFISVASDMGINNPSLEKGILLCGNYGVGKSWMMKLFMKNKRQVYMLYEAKELSRLYKEIGEESLEPFNHKYKNAFEDPTVLYQEFSGMCVDDIGAEDVKTNYGDKKNVIGDLIEMRYAKTLMGVLFHGTTNLTAKQIGEYYGGRVASRLRETVNFIELSGDDRRK